MGGHSRTGIEGLFDDALVPTDFTLVDLDAGSREEGVSPVGSEAEARRVLARARMVFTTNPG